MTTAELTPRQTPTGNGAAPARLARKRFDPTQLFAQRDRLPWFWFFVAVAVTVLAALDRYHLIGQFKQRERVVIIDPSQTYYLMRNGHHGGLNLDSDTHHRACDRECVSQG